MASNTLFMSSGVKAGGYDIRGDVLKGIQKASATTGVDFGYLMAQAAKESGFDPKAQAKSSSAAGLYQFVEQTWLSVVRKHGADHGLGHLSSKIKIGEDGKMRVADAGLRRQILDLRRDPEIAAVMAAEHAADNKKILETKLKRPATATDLYMAHFLGVSGAVKFLREMKENPNQAAADHFVRAASANRSIFYNEDGRAKSLKEVYQRFDQRMTKDIAVYDDYGGGASKSEDDPLMMADIGHGGVATSLSRNATGHANPGGVLSPTMLVALASLPVGRGEVGSNLRRGLFDQTMQPEPLV